jgi:hypothetical protein
MQRVRNRGNSRVLLESLVDNANTQDVNFGFLVRDGSSDDSLAFCRDH